jgi:hypothetical protein
MARNAMDDLLGLRCHDLRVCNALREVQSRSRILVIFLLFFMPSWKGRRALGSNMANSLPVAICYKYAAIQRDLPTASVLTEITSFY